MYTINLVQNEFIYGVCFVFVFSENKFNNDFQNISLACCIFFIVYMVNINKCKYIQYEINKHLVSHVQLIHAFIRQKGRWLCISGFWTRKYTNLKKNIGRPARLINQSYCSSIICIDDRISVTSNIFLDFQLNGFNYKKNLKQGNLIIKVVICTFCMFLFSKL